MSARSLAPESVGRENLLHPLLRGSILSEQDDAFLRPPSPSYEVFGQPISVSVGLRIRFAGRRLCPGAQSLELPRRRSIVVGTACRLLDRFSLGRVRWASSCVVLLGLRYGATKDTIVEISLDSARLGVRPPRSSRYAVPTSTRKLQATMPKRLRSN